MTQAEKLLNYYLRCVEEIGQDSIFSTVADKSKFLKITNDEVTQRLDYEFDDNEKNLIKKLVIQNPNMDFWYGYPCLYVKQKYNWEVRPVFFCKLQFDSATFPYLDKTLPNINTYAFSEINGEFFNPELLFKEFDALINEGQMGYDYTELFNELFIHKRIIDSSIFNNLNSTDPENIGIFEHAGIFVTNKSNFTQGLRYELNRLLNLGSCFDNTVLKYFFNKNKTELRNNNFSIFPLNEVYELNKEQKEAVYSAFKNNITVIQGPPGTGKSQVVASIIINAVLKNEKVLLASFSNKAVEVVEEKLNKLSKKPFILRLGKRNDLRTALNDYLNWVLNSSYSQDKIIELNEFVDELNYQSEQKEKIEKQKVKLIEKRNDIEKLLKRIKRFKNYEILIKKLSLNSSIKKHELLNPKNLLITKYLKKLSIIQKEKSLEELLIEQAKIDFEYKNTCIEFLKCWIESLPSRLNLAQKKTLHRFASILIEMSGARLTTSTYRELINEKLFLMKGIVEFLNAWCVTSLSANGELPLIEGFFDLLIIDEASQCDIPSAIPLLFRAKRVIVLGDPRQLQHIDALGNRQRVLFNQNGLGSDKENNIYMYSNSFLDLAFQITKSESIKLREHFRSHYDIIQFSNKTWYDNTLIISTDYNMLNPCPIENKSYHAIEWIDVQGEIIQKNNSSALIMAEAEKVIDILDNLINKNNFNGEIGIITPFRLQANMISELFNKSNKFSLDVKKRVIIDTIVKYQGDEKDIIIYSAMISKNMPKGVLYYHKEVGNLLNVAITRARAKLIIIGDSSVCINYPELNISKLKSYKENIELVIEKKIETEEEQILYRAMLENHLIPIPQYIIDQYRLDFALFTKDKKIDIEVDGINTHIDINGDQLKRDIIRTRRLQKQGWVVLRFWNYEIRHRLDLVLKRLFAEINKKENTALFFNNKNHSNDLTLPF